jgi:hypothetical protein
VENLEMSNHRAFRPTSAKINACGLRAKID